MSALRVHVAGIGLWSAELAGFAAFRAWLDGAPPAPPGARPTAAALSPNERRRAPESVLLAAEVAGQAVAMSGLDAAELACVFASAHGDQVITDYLCATLAQEPTALSPTRFHNSVHNAPVGYWTIATGCRAPSTAVCAGRTSFGAGLLEATAQALAGQQPVLLVAADGPGQGPLATMTGCATAFACALVLTPQPDAHTLATLHVRLEPGEASMPSEALMKGWPHDNASAAALPLLARLARAGGACRLPAAERLVLDVHTEPTA
ncbi:beta-ketoacyl synthase chain length factor [Frateuria defendens]|uniref:beta-ketoacyl synthase chain length factor n=1 Tax=Frateuria defendens TaxID=2219559 RepID=UPI00066FC129|nr:beta-ketoacyl synthase chain length factor [Frateuria defendens]